MMQTAAGMLPFAPVLEQFWHVQIDSFRRSEVGSLRQSMTSRTSDSSDAYDPFDSLVVDLLPFLSIFLVGISSLWYFLAPSLTWLHFKPVTVCVRTLSPFITEDDLKRGRGLDSDTFLRRGAVHKEDDDPGEYDSDGFARQDTKIAVICMLSFLEVFGWTVAFGWNVAFHGFSSRKSAGVLASLSILFTWVATTLFIHVKRPHTPPIRILVLVLLQLLTSSIRLLNFVPLLQAQRMNSLLVSQFISNTVDLLICLSIVGIIFTMPVAAGGLEAQVPRSERCRLAGDQEVIETEDLQKDYEACPTTPEDYASLASTLTYTWMESIQRLALKRPLLPSDIWRLRSINDTRVLSRKFATLSQVPFKRTLARRLLLCNANDIALDFTYKICGVTLAYAGPALMRSILECISDAAAAEGVSSWTLHRDGLKLQLTKGRSGIAADEPRWTPRSKAFVLALLALAFTLVRYVAELKNFHHARQVGLRIRSVLVVELLEKALKRRDVRGSAGPSKEDDADIGEAQEGFDHAKSQVDGFDNVNNLGKDLNDTARQEGDDETSTLLDHDQLAAEEVRKPHKKPMQPKESVESQADVGKVVNMMAEDINTLLRLGCDSHQLYGAPLEVIIATTFLYQLLGWSSLVGFGLLVGALPLNYFLGRWYMKSATAWRKATDERISLVTELLMAIRFIKLQGVQDKWSEKIMDARIREMWQMIYANAKEFLMIILWVAVPISCTILTFFIYTTYQGEVLTIPVAFTALTLFSMLRSPLDVIPSFAMSILRAIVSVRRLDSFLAEEEVDECISAIRNAKSMPSNVEYGKDDASIEPLSIDNGTFTWQQSDDGFPGRKKASFALTNITVSFPPDGLSLIEGPTASGKSSLLAALLGEMKRTGGTQSIPKFSKTGRCLFSFAGQVPWVEAGKSVKRNITFITPFDEERYRMVVHACALQDDIDEWEDGDETRVSKETLSGGQKARISLARALYSHSRTVFLDDILSAVDTRVQNHIYRNALTGPIARGRRIVLVTHHVSLVMPSVKYLVRLKNGRVEACGPVEQLQKEDLLEVPSFPSGASSIRSVPSSLDLAPESRGDTTNVEGEQPAPDSKKARLLYDLEGRNVGSVKWDCYRLYLGASSTSLWIVVIAASVLLRIVTAGEQYWLKLWGEASIRPSYRLPLAAGHQSFYLSIYALIGLVNVLTILVRTAMYYMAAYRASKRLYVMLLESVVHARMRFFDKNPTGRILQRFNSDFSLVDGQLPLTFLRLSANSLAFASSALICIVIVPGFAILIALCIGLSYFARGFLRSTMYMQRIEATSTSPLYSAFTQILEGLVTVRAFAAEAYFMDQMQTITAITSAQWWAIATMEVWISFRSQIISGISVFVATCLALSGAVSPGSAGMVIASSNLVTTYVYWLTLDYKHLSNNSNSIERVKEYIELEQEAPEKVEGHPVPAAWPSSDGSIHVRDLSIRYDNNLPEVLHSISFDVKSREKIAVVGRTGSGKTSLISAFLRATEPSRAESQIIIDGLDIMKLGLEYRNRITIVPQDPMLFSGTIKHNLDPFDEKSDEECQWALDRVHINKNILQDDIGTQGGTSSKKRKKKGYAAGKTLVTLDTTVAPGGSNFSAGQAQLISLARALLRDARVVILDEATSSTDFETDKAIQQSIREMGQSIIIAVAHRLTTVIDYDRVLVMCKGHIVEFDTPYNLLSKSDDDPDAHFKDLCKEAGPIVYKKLCQAVGIDVNVA